VSSPGRGGEKQLPPEVTVLVRLSPKRKPPFSSDCRGRWPG